MASGVGCGEVEGEVTYRMTDEGDARRCFQTARDVYFVPGSGENIEFENCIKRGIVVSTFGEAARRLWTWNMAVC